MWDYSRYGVCLTFTRQYQTQQIFTRFVIMELPMYYIWNSESCAIVATIDVLYFEFFLLHVMWCNSRFTITRVLTPVHPLEVETNPWLSCMLLKGTFNIVLIIVWIKYYNRGLQHWYSEVNRDRQIFSDLPTSLFKRKSKTKWRLIMTQIGSSN